MATNIAFWFSAAVALVASVTAITRRSAVHGLVWFILSLLAVAVLFFLLGAPFAAALEIIVYAGAIMVLFLFVVMMLNLGEKTEATENLLLPVGAWITPAIGAFGLGVVLAAVLWGGGRQATGGAMVGPEAVGAALYGPYVLGVELASMLLLAGLVAAYHIGHRPRKERAASAEGADSGVGVGRGGTAGGSGPKAGRETVGARAGAGCGDGAEGADG